MAIFNKMIVMAYVLLQALWFIWPAYCANAFPAVMNGKKPLDFGKNLGENRILGNSKTIEGTIGGILFGIFVGLVQMNVYSSLPEIGLARFTPEMIVLLSCGALAGDVAGSFVKRRLGIKSGQPAILLDQLGFLLVSLIFVSLVFVPPVEIVVLLVILTPLIHFLTNVIGYYLKWKKHPW